MPVSLNEYLGEIRSFSNRLTSQIKELTISLLMHSMHSISGTSMGPKKMVPLIECSTPIFGKTGQLQMKKSKSEKRNEKISFKSLSMLI